MCIPVGRVGWLSFSYLSVSYSLEVSRYPIHSNALRVRNNNRYAKKYFQEGILCMLNLNVSQVIRRRRRWVCALCCMCEFLYIMSDGIKLR